MGAGREVRPFLLGTNVSQTFCRYTSVKPSDPRGKLDAAKRREIAESVVSGRKSVADMARLYNVSQPTVSHIVAEHLVDRALRAVIDRSCGDPTLVRLEARCLSFAQRCSDRP